MKTVAVKVILCLSLFGMTGCVIIRSDTGKTVTYRCEDGAKIFAVYDNHGAGAVVISDGATYSLPRAAGDTDISYSDDYTFFRHKNGQASFVSGNIVHENCSVTSVR